MFSGEETKKEAETKSMSVDVILARFLACDLLVLSPVESLHPLLFP